MSRSDGLAHLDRLARMSRVDGNWMTPAVSRRPPLWWTILMAVSLGIAVLALIYAALLAGGVT